MKQRIEGHEPSQFLSFHIAGEEYGVGILRVREIIEYDILTTVPGTPASIRGVINLRGAVVPVVDLAAKFGLPPGTPGRRSCIVIVEVAIGDEQAVMGILCDAVSQVIDLKGEDIVAPPPFGTRVRTEYLYGMGKIGKKFVLLLDIDRVLTESENAATQGPLDAHEAPAVEDNADAEVVAT